MFVFAGIALLKASSPVLGTLVSGEKRTAFAGDDTGKTSQPTKGSGEDIWTNTRITAIRLSNLFLSGEVDVEELVRVLC